MPTLDAPIIAVTVFRDRARVTRRGTAQLAPGEHTLTIGGLPASIAPDSIRAGGRGAGVKILGVDVATEYVTQAPEANIAELTRQLEALQGQDRALQDDDTAQNTRLEFLKALRESGGANLAKGLAYGRAGIDTVETLAAYLAREQELVARRRREVDQQRRALGREIEAIRARLAQVRPPVPQERRAITVAVEASAAAELALEVTYLVYGASWEPNYDVRLVDGTVTLNYLASVRQQTGEDWPAIELALSTARPAVSTAIPELHPWYLDIYRPPPAPVMRRMAAPMATPAAMVEAAMTLADEAEPGALAGAAPAVEIAQATIDSSGASVTYRIARPVAVPSDGSPHRASVTVLELPANLDYITAPKLAEEAYLRAKVSNTSSFVMLPGGASIFHGEEFVGSTRLETTAPAEEFELQLGIDDRIKVERELIGRKVDKSLIGNTRRTQISYRIKLTNLLDRQARVKVLDQLPVSRHEEIKVKIGEMAPRPSEQSDLNLLTWELELRPQEKVELIFAFTVEHQRELQVVGLNV